MKRGGAILGVILVLLLVAWWRSGGSPPEELGGEPEAALARRAPRGQVASGKGAASGDDAADMGAPGLVDPNTGTDRSRTLEEQAEALARDPVVDVICALDPAIDEGRAYLAVGEPGSFKGRLLQVVLGDAYLPLLDERGGEGWLSVEGYGPTPVRWTAPTEDGPGRCLGEPVTLREGGTVITGTVRHADGGAPARNAWVEGCGGLGMTDEDGAYYMEVVAGPCAVMALRQDGQLRTIGPAAEVVAKAGVDTVVDLEIPGFPRAGLGVMDGVGLPVELGRKPVR